MRSWWLVFLATISLIGGSPKLFAHAFLDHANPRVGSSVRTPPREITLWFTQNLESAFSTISVSGPSGQKVDDGRARISGSTMRIGIRPSGSGSYHVNWRVLSVDTHTTEGSFSFRVGE